MNKQLHSKPQIQAIWLVALSGIYCLIVGLILLEDYRHTSISAVGIILAMTSALSYALYVYRSKRMIQNTHSSYFTIIIYFNCAAVFFIITTATHTFTYHLRCIAGYMSLP